MITVNSSPQELSLAKNLMILDLSTDNQFSTAGQNAVFEITLSQVPTDNDTFTLTMGNGVIMVFTLKDNSHDDSGYQAEFQGSVQLSYAAMRASMLKNYYLGTFYDIEAPTGLLRFTAKNPGDDYNLTLSNAPGYMSSSLPTTGVNKAENDLFKIFVQIYKRRRTTDDWVILERFVKPYEGNVQVDLGPSLDDDYYLARLPDPSLLYKLHKYSIGYYKVFLAESYGSPPVIRGLNEQSEKRYSWGGLGVQENLNSDFTDSWITPQKGLMTRISAPVDLYSNERHILSYCHFATADTLQINYEFTLMDGSKVNQTNSVSSVGQYEVLTLTVDPLDFSPSLIEIRSLVIFISKNGNPATLYSQKIQFNFKQVRPVDSLQLTYQNTLGFFDSYNLRGVQVLKANVVKEEASLNDTKALRPSEHSDFVTSLQGGFSLEVNTGHLNKAEAMRLLDLLMSKKVFALKSDNYLYPVKIESTSDLQISSTKSGTTNNQTLVISNIQDENYEPYTT